MNGFEQLFSRWKQGYYAQPFYIICEMVAFIIAMIFVRRYRIGIFFIIYIAFDFLILLLDIYVQYFSTSTKSQKAFLIGCTNAMIYMVEISVYYYYFFYTLNSIQIKRYIIAAYVLFSAFFLTFVMISLGIIDLSAGRISDFLGGSEFILIIPVCFAYYLELFNSPVVKLFQRPSFWITTGIFFFAVVSLPYYLLNEFISIEHHPYFRKISPLLFDLPFGLNFLFLTRGFLCKRQLTI